MVVGRLSMMMHKVIMLFFKTIFALSRIVPGQNNGDSAAVKLFTNRALIALWLPLAGPSCLEVILRLTTGPTWELILMISAVTHIWIIHYCRKIIKKLGLIDKLLLEHVGLPHVLDLAWSTWSIFSLDESRGSFWGTFTISTYLPEHSFILKGYVI